MLLIIIHKALKNILNMYFITVIIKGNADAGHWSKVFDLNYQTDRIEFFKY